MPGARQDILVKIRALVEGMADVRELGRHIGKLQSGGGSGGQAVALAGDIDKLSAAVDRLATASEKSDRSRGGFVRFLQGTAAVVNILSSIPQAFEGVRRLLDFGDRIAGVIGPALGRVKDVGATLGSTLSGAVAGGAARAGTAVAAAGRAVAGLGGALKAAGPIGLIVVGVLTLLLAALTPLIIGFGGLAAAVGVGSAALAFIAQRGFEFHRAMEQVRLGIAAVITSLADLKVDGLPVEGAEKFRVAMELSADQLKKLQVDAVNTTATFEQIAPAFQTAIGPGLAAGLNLDEIRGLTVQIVQAAGALGLPLNQVNQEVRAILEGTINEDARLAKVLGISNEMVKSWRQQGTLAEELNKRLAAFSIAGVEAATTVDGLTSNLQEALNVFSGEATTRAFAALKAEFARLLPQLFDFKNAGIAAQFKSLAELADDVLVRVIRIGGEIVQGVLDGIKRVSAFVEQNRATINDILNLGGFAVRLVLQIVGVFGRLATDTSAWRGGLELVRGVLSLINLILAAVAVRLKQLEPALRFAAQVAALLIAATPGLAAASAAGSTGGQDSRTEAQRALDDLAAAKAGMSPEELRARGFKPDISIAGPKGGGGGGGKKGGGGRKSQLPELTAQAEDAALATDRARVERAFNLTRDFLERQSALIERALDERRISIGRYYDDEERIQREAIEAEIKKINELRGVEERRRDAAKKRIDDDKELTGPEREQKKKAVDQEFSQAVIPLVERLTILDRERLDLAGKIAAGRKKEVEAFETMLREINEQLALETGDVGGAIDAARRRIDEANKERLERIAIEKGAGSTEHQQAAQLVEVLKKKAEYQLLYNQLRQQEDSLRFAEDRIRADVDRGLITEKVAREKIIEAQLKHKAAVEETVAKLNELASASGDPQLILDAERAAESLKDLGRVIDEHAVRINVSLKEAVKGTLFDILRDPSNAISSITRLFNHILDEITRLATDRLFDYIFGPEGVLSGVFGGKTGGGVGGVLSDIFGTRPATPQGGTGGVSGGTPPFINNLFSVIKGFQGGALLGLGNVRTSTQGLRDDVRGGIGQVNTNFGTAIDVLGNISSSLSAQAAAGIAAAAANIFKVLTAGGGVEGSATGSFQEAAPGGRIVRVAEAGFPEVILTTDPKYRRRTAGLLGAFLRRAGMLPDLGSGVLSTVSDGIPNLAAGAWVEAGPVEPPPAGMTGDNVTIHAPVTIQATDAASFRGSEHQIMREVSRRVQQGYQRAKARPKG